MDLLVVIWLAAAVMSAIEAVLQSGPRTRDMGGDASTTAVGTAVAARVAG